MASLNEDVDISRADPRDLFAFTRTLRRVLFYEGDWLFRFISSVSPKFAGNNLFGSPWWHPQRTFNGLVRTATRTGASVKSTARSRLAVTEEWNPSMDWLAIIELTTKAFGWVGPATPQPARSGDRSVLLMGHAEQVYMPGLAGAGDGQSSPYAFVQYYGQGLDQ
jgi:hypothetical protein